MVKTRNTKRLSSASQSNSSQGVDLKARRRIEDLFELTDEIINAYNEINEKYVSQIYRKYQRLKEQHLKLQEKFKKHHCTGCQCQRNTTNHQEETDQSTEVDERSKPASMPSSSTITNGTRSKKNNPFIISDIEETQNLDENDSRFRRGFDDEDEDDDDEMTSNGTLPKVKKPLNDDDPDNHDEQSADEAEDDDDDDNDDGNSEKEADENHDDDDDDTSADDNGMARLPLSLQVIIQRKAEKNNNAKAYLLEIPRYPALCEYLKSRSRMTFSRRPTDEQVRPFIADHIGRHVANNSKGRLRIRDELREIHRSYLRTLMGDARATSFQERKSKQQLSLKKSPL